MGEFKESFRKQITFDLDTKELEKYCPLNNWRSTYNIIKRHMTKNGFFWVQGSAYISSEPMQSRQVTRILKKLIKDNPWLHKCMRDCRETDIGKEHSKNGIFKKNANIPTRAELQNTKARSMSDWEACIAERKAKDIIKTVSSAKVKVATKEKSK